MLNQSDKERIKAEEIFRNEVRKELEQGKKNSKFWVFLNSSFGIFILSSVLIGGLSFGYKE
ncbi:hypothetical protein [Fulvivirga ligni]|uniref:hypothetical protein n=1 Tax=Fulvivirga ligni TaxID=2904246 RepID=UPI001F39510D|nr:hypothetical protein [Fulvivirga ligni]UII20846.1 hypothetical protein LVD16_23680 [Fulvivirga ligni]